MKKSIVLFLTIILLSIVLISCDGSDLGTDVNNGIIKPSQKITISFNSNGGNEIESIIQSVDKLYELPVPVKNGYSFDGWYNGEIAINSSGVWTIDKNTELDAKWTATKYAINYISLGGKNTNPLTYTIEDEIVFEKLEWIVEENDTIAYEFAGWYKDASYSEPFDKIEIGTTGIVDIYAKWNAVNIPEEKTTTTIIFNAEGFECDKTDVVVTVGDNYYFPVLEKEGYNFIGWKTENDNVSVPATGIWVEKSANLTLVPNWSKRAYSITYVINDGKNDDRNPETFYITDTITLYAPQKDSYYFDGWYLDEKFENKIEKIDAGTKAGITVYAKWLAEYVITYDFIEEDNQQTVVLYKEYTLKTVDRLGYVFDGWYYNDKQIDKNGIWTITSDVSLIAKWTPINYSISYDLDGGEKDDGNYPESYNIETDKLQIGIPTRENYKFVGWQNGDKIRYFHKIKAGSYGDISLKAMWYKIEYTYQDKNGIQYLLKDDNSLSVVGYVGEPGNIFIPAQYEGYTVTEIGDYAFCGYGEALLSLSSFGFARCDIAETVTKIGIGAFDGCDDLKVQLSYHSDLDVEAWSNNLIIEERNNHVYDVINGKRPAIGWNEYWIPK